MSDGRTVIQSWIERLRDLGESVDVIAGDIAPEFRFELEGNIMAARSPDGTPWKPTQSGSAPLQEAGKALGVAAVGSKVIAVLRGVEARHHYGHVRGRIARPILPSSKLPAQIVELITRVANQRFRLIMGGA